MKIVRIDNFGRESRSDDLVAENLSDHYAYLISDMLNEKFSGNDMSDFYKVFEDDYILYEFKP